MALLLSNGPEDIKLSSLKLLWPWPPPNVKFSVPESAESILKLYAPKRSAVGSTRGEGGTFPAMPRPNFCLSSSNAGEPPKVSERDSGGGLPSKPPDANGPGDSGVGVMAMDLRWAPNNGDPDGRRVPAARDFLGRGRAAEEEEGEACLRISLTPKFAGRVEGRRRNPAADAPNVLPEERVLPIPMPASCDLRLLKTSAPVLLSAEAGSSTARLVAGAMDGLRKSDVNVDLRRAS
mmetsp:Transcript_31304/g.50551  ORF Transcript_31304/g.50551 Transcript_31304/m.50551 type:complete len:235 (-) Transcript_31304:102-806(-)